MKLHLTLIGLLALLLLSGCGKTELLPSEDDPEFTPVPDADIPEGYFVVTFSGFSPDSRAAINDTTSRVQSLRYILYKSTGEFVKERLVFSKTVQVPNGLLPPKKTHCPKGHTGLFF